ncbi:MAG: hypothetical protein JSR67_12950 [Proteobacteria bacterium]|nr:hypothetical protein [Pseudomonadota bacterium]
MTLRAKGLLLAGLMVFGASPTWAAADAARTPIEQAERACEDISQVYMGLCVRSMMASVYAGQPEWALDRFLSMPPVAEYLAWLDVSAGRLPSKGPQRARLIHTIRDRTTEVARDVLLAYVSEADKRLQQLQTELAKVKESQNAEDREERKTQQLIQLMKLMNATAAPAPSVTCNTHRALDGSVSTTCD